MQMIKAISAYLYLGLGELCAFFPGRENSLLLIYPFPQPSQRNMSMNVMKLASKDGKKLSKGWNIWELCIILNTMVHLLCNSWHAKVTDGVPHLKLTVVRGKCKYGQGSWGCVCTICCPQVASAVVEFAETR